MPQFIRIGVEDMLKNDFKNFIYIIEEKIGYEFENKMLLQQAFTRRSYSNEHNCEDNEVLEFIGDKVLDFIVVKILSESTGE